MARLRRRALRATFLSTLVLVLIAVAVSPAHSLAPGCLWSQRFGGTGNDYGYAVAVDASGNVVVAGTFQGTVDFGSGPFTSAGASDIFLAKYSADGAPLWSKRFGSISSDFSYAVAVDATGNIILTGGFLGTVDFGGGPLVGAGSTDIVLAKYDATGAHVWSKRFGTPNADYCLSVATDALNNVVITGMYMGALDFGGGGLASAGEYDAFLARYDASGSYQWSQRYGGIGTDQGEGVAIDSAGNVYLAGSFYDTVDFGGGSMVSAGLEDVFFASYTSGGTYRWGRRFGGISGDSGSDVEVDASGDVYLCGYFSDTVNFGGADLTSAGASDIFLAKYNGLGVHQWSERFGGAGTENALALAADHSGSIFMAGFFSVPGSFGCGNFSSAGGLDMYVLKYSALGTCQWTQRYGGAGDDSAYNLAVDASDNLLLAGRFQQTVDFGAGPLASAGGSDVLLLKLAGDLQEPVITSIRDVGNDQGRKVKILFSAAAGDDAAATVPVTHYVAFRRDDAPPASTATTNVPAHAPAAALRAAGWIEVGSVGAFAEPGYGIIVPTIGDSTIALGQYYSVFFIRAATDEPSRFFDSPPDSGWSRDDLAPSVPSSFAYSAGNLTWNKSAAEDFDYFTVYGSNADDFARATVVNYTIDTGMPVAGAPYVYYYVTATDFSGNEGKPAVVNTLSGVGGTPRSYVLSVSNYPNPFNPRTTVKYTVPARGHVSVRIYDASGALVRTLFDGERGAGPYSAEWNGLAENGSAVGSGVYFARITRNGETRTTKMTLLK